jgi:hypothetical protein
VTFPVLTTIGTGRRIDPAQLDRPAVFLCFTQATEREPEPVELAIRAQYNASQVLVVYVVDLHALPGMMRPMAERLMKGEFEKAARGVPDGETVEDYVVLAPDWDGSFVAALRFSEDVSKRMGAAVFGRDGSLLGTSQGTDTARECLALLAEPLPPT